MPEISIIVPVYNVEKYIRRCLDSILAQTFTDWECILVDDGSPDNSGTICDEYTEKDNRFRVIHKENGGQAIARNVALDIAQGEYFAFIDSDDCVHPQYLDILYSTAKQHNATISVCSAISFSVKPPEQENIKEICSVKKGAEFFRDCFLGAIDYKPWVLWDKLWKRECFDNIRMPAHRKHEDNAIVYKMLYEADTIVDCNNQLYYYFSNPSGTMGEHNPQRRLDYIKVLQEMLAFFSDKNDPEILRKLNRNYLYYLEETCVLEKTLISQLKPLIKKQIAHERQYYKIDITTHSRLFNIVYPIRSKIHWTIQGLKHKMKGKK